MERSWLVDSWAIARKVKNVSLPPASQIKDCGVKSECPNCHHSIDNSDVSPEWPGLPAGVNFDPSEVELLEHFRTKCGAGSSDHTHFLSNSYEQLNQVVEYVTPILRIFLDTGKPSHRLECNQQYNECLAGKSQLEEYDETCEIDCFLLCRELVSQSHFSA